MRLGFTLVEILVTVAILALLLGVLIVFETDIFQQNSILQNSLLANQDARQALRRLTAELRAGGPSAGGAYALAQATPTTITFFSDADGDGAADQLRYFLSGTTLARGATPPSGSPPVYPAGDETLTTMASGLLPDPNQTIFSYYDDNYAGTTTPLAVPINLPLVRLVRVTLAIDQDSNRPPGPSVYQTEVVIRSLKDNL